jgi:hypothetical protein
MRIITPFCHLNCKRIWQFSDSLLPPCQNMWTQNLKTMLQWMWIIFWTPLHRLGCLQMRCFRKGTSGGSYTFGLLRKCTVSYWTMVKPNWHGPLHLTIKTVSDTMFEKKPRWQTTSRITVPNHCEKYLNLATKTQNQHKTYLFYHYFTHLYLYICT